MEKFRISSWPQVLYESTVYLQHAMLTDIINNSSLICVDFLRTWWNNGPELLTGLVSQSLHTPYLHLVLRQQKWCIQVRVKTCGCVCKAYDKYSLNMRPPRLHHTIEQTKNVPSRTKYCIRGLSDGAAEMSPKMAGRRLLSISSASLRYVGSKTS